MRPGKKGDLVDSATVWSMWTATIDSAGMREDLKIGMAMDPTAAGVAV